MLLEYFFFMFVSGQFVCLFVFILDCLLACVSVFHFIVFTESLYRVDSLAR